MSGHVPDELLADFVAGDVDDQIAVHVAEHLDACPVCATRAAAMEPLGQALAAIDDPKVPVGLVDRIVVAANADVLVQARTASPTAQARRLEVGIGVGLLAAAAGVAVLGGEPIRAALAVGVTVDVLLHGAEQAASLFTWALCALGLGAALAASFRSQRFSWVTA